MHFPNLVSYRFGLKISSSLTRPLLLYRQSHLVWRPGNVNIWSVFVSCTGNIAITKEINPTISF